MLDFNSQCDTQLLNCTLGYFAFGDHHCFIVKKMKTCSEKRFQSYVFDVLCCIFLFISTRQPEPMRQYSAKTSPVFKKILMMMYCASTRKAKLVEGL